MNISECNNDLLLAAAKRIHAAKYNPDPTRFVEAVEMYNRLAFFDNKKNSQILLTDQDGKHVTVIYHE
jgi:hypothetical protein